MGYTTAMPTNYSIYCLQQDPHYRGDCTTRGYYQHPNTGFYLGGDMPMPPLPPVFEADVRNQMASGKSVMFDLQGDNHEPIAVNHEPTVLYLMNPRGHDYTFTGKGTTGSGRLIKSMQGTATVNGNLGHTGLNLISEGTLEVNGQIAGPVELRARGTLSGNATLKDTITFEGALNYEGCRLMPWTDGVEEEHDAARQCLSGISGRQCTDAICSGGGRPYLQGHQLHHRQSWPTRMPLNMSWPSVRAR